jgi:hypothetical protein
MRKRNRGRWRAAGRIKEELQTSEKLKRASREIGWHSFVAVQPDERKNLIFCSRLLRKQRHMARIHHRDSSPAK